MQNERLSSLHYEPAKFYAEDHADRQTAEEKKLRQKDLVRSTCHTLDIIWQFINWPS